MNRPDRPISWAFRVPRRFVRLLRRGHARLRLGHRLTMGSNVVMGRSARLLSPEFVRIGNNVAIGADFHVETNLVVGSDVLISSRVSIVGRDHRFDDPSTTVFWAGRLPAVTVTIEGDNLIGFGTIIVGPATIGRGCIVGAGSVVTGNLPSNTVCVGVPARPIRQRFLERS